MSWFRTGDRTALETTKISVFVEWKKEFYSKEQHQRLGQAFLNKFYPGVVFSKLFYEEKAELAEKIIYQIFLEA